MRLIFLAGVVVIVGLGVLLSVRNCSQPRRSFEFSASFSAEPVEGLEPLSVTFTAQVTATEPVTVTIDFDGDGVEEFVSAPSPNFSTSATVTYYFPNIDPELQEFVIVRASMRVWHKGVTVWESFEDIRVFLLPSPQIWPIALTCSATLDPEKGFFRELFIFVISSYTDLTLWADFDGDGANDFTRRVSATGGEEIEITTTFDYTREGLWPVKVTWVDSTGESGEINFVFCENRLGPTSPYIEVIPVVFFPPFLKISRVLSDAVVRGNELWGIFEDGGIVYIRDGKVWSRYLTYTFWTGITRVTDGVVVWTNEGKEALIFSPELEKVEKFPLPPTVTSLRWLAFLDDKLFAGTDAPGGSVAVLCDWDGKNFSRCTTDFIPDVFEANGWAHRDDFVLPLSGGVLFGTVENGFLNIVTSFSKGDLGISGNILKLRVTPNFFVINYFASISRLRIFDRNFNFILDLPEFEPVGYYDLAEAGNKVVLARRGPPCPLEGTTVNIRGCPILWGYSLESLNEVTAVADTSCTKLLVSGDRIYCISGLRGLQIFSVENDSIKFHKHIDLGDDIRHVFAYGATLFVALGNAGVIAIDTSGRFRGQWDVVGDAQRVFFDGKYVWLAVADDLATVSGDIPQWEGHILRLDFDGFRFSNPVTLIFPEITTSFHIGCIWKSDKLFVCDRDKIFVLDPATGEKLAQADFENFILDARERDGKIFLITFSDFAILDTNLNTLWRTEAKSNFLCLNFWENFAILCDGIFAEIRVWDISRIPPREVSSCSLPYHVSIPALFAEVVGDTLWVFASVAGILKTEAKACFEEGEHIYSVVAKTPVERQAEISDFIGCTTLGDFLWCWSRDEIRRVFVGR